VALFDEVGYWSEVKLEIVRKYAQAYSKILRASGLHHVYIDAFSGPGLHISKGSGGFIPGSPLNALNVQPPFEEYYFIDIEQRKVDALAEIVGDRSDVHVLQGDCNERLLKDVFPKVRYKDYRRGLCFLDPYGLSLSWDVIKAAGALETLDIFLNFPLADMNRNVLRRIPEDVDPQQRQRMNRFWGDESWRDAAYSRAHDLFGEYDEKASNEAIAGAFRKRLTDVAGFAHVPEPMPMRNSRKAVVYYLFSASHNKTAAKIAKDIFDKYRERGL